MSTMRRKELSAEEQKNLIMTQVKAATGDPTALASQVAQTTIPPAPVSRPPEQPVFQPTDPLPTIEDVMQTARPPLNPVEPNDIVQVVNPRNGHYGLLFILGGIADGQAHGFYIAQGPRREFITVPLADVYSHGVSKVLSRDPMSREWMQQHGLVGQTPVGNQGGGAR